MRIETADYQPADLQKLAEETKSVAETTNDPNGQRALRFVALAYARLAQFASVKTNVPAPASGLRTNADDVC